MKKVIQEEEKTRKKSKEYALGFWKNEKVVKYFTVLTDHCIVPSVKWDKFRRLDKKGIFSTFSNPQLSMFYKKLKESQNANSI